jgi:hypothetical protein
VFDHGEGRAAGGRDVAVGDQSGDTDAVQEAHAGQVDQKHAGPGTRGQGPSDAWFGQVTSALRQLLADSIAVTPAP